MRNNLTKCSMVAYLGATEEALMPKCKFCVPYRSEENFCTLTVQKVLKEEKKNGDLVTCEKNTFPGFGFCPAHLQNIIDISKLTAEYIANKEE